MSSGDSMELGDIAYRVLNTCRELRKGTLTAPLAPEQIIDIERVATMAYKMSFYPAALPPRTVVFNGKPRCQHEFRPTWTGGFCGKCNGWFTY